MQIEVVGTPEDAACRAADIVCEAVRARPAPILGLASGETPLGLYAELSRRVRVGEIDLSDVIAFAIDELCGVEPTHPATNAAYFAREFRIPTGAVLVMDSKPPNSAVECAGFRERIARAGGLDLVLLGIGRNGHLAFNEPGSPFDSRARRVVLEQGTREAYVPRFGSLEATPALGLTLGLGDLLSARRVLLLAIGRGKAAIVARALEGPVDEALPASALQRHANTTAVLDRAAAALLRQPRS